MIETFVGALISVITIISYIEIRINRELKPNHGSSIKDQINKLAIQMEIVLKHLGL